MIVQDPNRRSPELEDIARDGGDRRRRRGNPSSAASSTPFFYLDDFDSDMLVFPNREGSHVKAKPRASHIAFTYS